VEKDMGGIMSLTPEGKVKKKVTDLLKELGVYYFYPVTGGYGPSGVPDIIICADGKFIAVECKAGSSTPTALQEAAMHKIRCAGGKTFVVNEDSFPLFALFMRSKNVRTAHSD